MIFVLNLIQISGMRRSFFVLRSIHQFIRFYRRKLYVASLSFFMGFGTVCEVHRLTTVGAQIKQLYFLWYYRGTISLLVIPSLHELDSPLRGSTEQPVKMSVRQKSAIYNTPHKQGVYTIVIKGNHHIEKYIRRFKHQENPISFIVFRYHKIASHLPSLCHKILD